MISKWVSTLRFEADTCGVCEYDGRTVCVVLSRTVEEGADVCYAKYGV
ncbi:MAG: hypothetical protein ACT6FC_07525 [Methanosarcinaceae archaeon]